ncbi:MAG: aldolase/citrate lyase family protein [Pseudomonadales bacterium]|jgi:4-hydroxy-2-oxoheptanedioate aldolase
MRENSLLSAWREGKQTIGCWLSMANAYSAESLAQLGFDYLCVDLQHGLIDYQDLTYMLPAISTGSSTPLVRVSWNEPYEIMKVLDAGAYGVIVPLVNNRADAQQAVAACRYPPDGNRSFGPIRAALYGGRGYAAEANQHIACIAMIETQEGLRNLDEILMTPGLNGIYIGPSDLALALGMPPIGDTDDLGHMETVLRILESCHNHGVPVGIHTSSLDYCQKRLAMGFDFITLGSDAGFMSRTAALELNAARGTANIS